MQVYTCIILHFFWSIGACWGSPPGGPLSGDLTRGFDVLSVTENEIYNFSAHKLVHATSRGEVLLLVTPDDVEERTLAISFRTPVENDKGCPHILEHSVLGGSQRYPLRFVIQNLQAGSAATFINAMTYPDRTTYPIATPVGEDFVNLASVYLDAVFKPLVLEDRDIFDREGWHYSMDDANGPLTYSGIVFNEMKGVYSNSKSLLTRKLLQGLMPNSTYNLVSGGLPTAIPDLSYAEFKEFYHRHYHGGNSKTFYMGPASEAGKLLGLLSPYLDEFADKFDPRSSYVAAPQAVQDPRYLTVYGPPDESPARDSYVFGVRLNDTAAPMADRVGLDMLSHVLLGNRVTPVYQMIEQQKWGSNVMDFGVFDYSQSIIFAAGVSGVPQTTADLSQKLEKVVTDELKRLSVEGFNEDAVQAAFTLVEFKLREQIGNLVNRGIKFMDLVFDEWNYDRDPLRGFDVLPEFLSLKAEYSKDKSVLTRLLKKYFIGNPNFVVIKMVADPNFAAERDLKERKALEDAKAGMSPSQLEEVVRRTAELRKKAAMPDSPEAVAKMPKLPLSAVAVEEKPIPLEVSKISNIFAAFHTLQTSGILYFTLSSDLRDLTWSELQVLPLLNYLLREGETKNLNRTALSYRIEETFGGLHFGSSFFRRQMPEQRVSDPKEAVGLWRAKFKCLRTSVSACFNLFGQILTESELENGSDQALTWLTEKISSTESSLVSNPSRLGKFRINSHLSVAGRAEEELEGVESVTCMRATVADIKSDWPTVVKRMRAAFWKIRSAQRVALDLAGDEETLEEIDPVLRRLIHQVLIFDSENTNSSWTASGLAYQAPQWIVRDDQRIDVSALLSSSLGRERRRTSWEGELRRASAWADHASSSYPRLLIQKGRKLIQQSEENLVATRAEGIVIPSMVSYVYLAGQAYPPGSPIRFEHIVPARLLSENHVFAKIRLVGGAYGASLSLLSKDGVLFFSTYRDPHVRESIRRMRNSPDAMLKIFETLPQSDITNEIIHIIAKLDSPMTNEAKAATSFMRWSMNETRAERNAMRRAILNTSLEDVLDFSVLLNGFLQQKSPSESSSSPALVVFGPENKLNNVTFYGEQLVYRNPLLE